MMRSESEIYSIQFIAGQSSITVHNTAIGIMRLRHPYPLPSCSCIGG